MIDTKAIPVTPEEDEAWDALADRLAEKVAAKLELPDDRPLLSVKKAAERLDISIKSMRDLVNRKGDRPPRIASVVIGDGSRKIEPATLDAYIEQQRRENDEYRESR
jgi:hypothetical protein